MDFEIAIPDIETDSLPSPEKLQYYEGLSRRTIWIDTEIDSSILEIGKKIIQWNFEDEDKDIPIEQRERIKLMIFSEGGSSWVMMHLGDIIAASKTPVATINMGCACSAACYLLISGHEGLRMTLKNATTMWHSGSLALEGTASQVKSANNYLTGQEERIKQVFLSRTKINQKTYKKHVDEDWFFTAEDALKYGLVDKIVESLDEVM